MTVRGVLSILAATVVTTGCAQVIRTGQRTAPEASSALPLASDGSLSRTVEEARSPGVFAPDRPPDTLWTIERGTYQGMRLAVRLDAALTGRAKGERFWRLPPGKTAEAGVVGWKSTRYPLPVAFRHHRSAGRISGADSTAFWKTLTELGADIGVTVFRPATVGDGDPDDVIVVDVGPMRGVDGLSRVSWSSTGELFDVRVTFSDAGALHDSRVVTHEMMHALGFGHTTAWTSVVNPWNANRPARLTPLDVAYAELAMKSRVKSERVDMRRLIALAAERESPQFRGQYEHSLCSPDRPDSSEGETLSGSRGLPPIGLLTVVSGCPPLLH